MFSLFVLFLVFGCISLWIESHRILLSNVCSTDIFDRRIVRYAR
jgi:hypothetical protein